MAGPLGRARGLRGLRRGPERAVRRGESPPGWLGVLYHVVVGGRPRLPGPDRVAAPAHRPASGNRRAHRLRRAAHGPPPGPRHRDVAGGAAARPLHGPPTPPWPPPPWPTCP